MFNTKRNISYKFEVTYFKIVIKFSIFFNERELAM